jgi:hypothetical protein
MHVSNLNPKASLSSNPAIQVFLPTTSKAGRSTIRQLIIPEDPVGYA